MIRQSNLPTHKSGSINCFSNDLIDFGNEERNSGTRDGKPATKPHRTSSRHSRPSRAASNTSSVGNSPHIKDWINQKSLQRIRDRHSAETYETRQMYNAVLHNEENFVKGVDELVKQQDLLNVRKKELLYKKWQENVYIPLRRRIELEIDGGFSKIDEKRRHEYLKYLQYKNKKGDVFLDTLSPEEYNPLVIYGPSSDVALQVKTERLRDPLLICERRQNDEDKFLHQCDTGIVLPNSDIQNMRLPSPPLVPLGRHGTNCTSWLSMPLRDIDSPVRRRSRNRMSGRVYRTDIDFEEWTRTEYGPETSDRELKIQRKRRFEIPSTMPSSHLLPLPFAESSKPGVRFDLKEIATSE